MASSSNMSQSQRLSPWAARFAQHEKGWAIDHDGVAHSLLAAILPRLDPRFQYDIPGAEQPHLEGTIEKPSDVLLDDLFFTERFQQLLTWGAKSRQLGVLSTGTFIGESGHTSKGNDSLGGTVISIDETKWLDCMQRNRWYKPAMIPGMVPLNHTQDLSTDDDDIWAYVRWPFEIANRILTQLIAEQHPFLDAILFGQVVIEEQEGSSTQPAKRRNLKPGEDLPKVTDDKRIFVFYRPQNQRPTSDVFRTMVQDRTRNVMWTFLDENDSRSGDSAWATTSILNWYSSVDSQGPILISICAQFIRGLLERTMTHTETCYAYSGMAVTILHELMHAMWMQRYFTGHFSIEPFINSEEICELGCASENAIFGGRYNFVAGPRFRLDGAFHGNLLRVFVADWPNSWDAMAYSSFDLPGQQKRTSRDGAQILGEGSQFFAWHVPALWVTYLFTEEFWHNSVAKYGSQAFKPPRMILGYTEYWRGANRAFALNMGDPQAEIPEIAIHLQDLRKRFLEREQYYTNIRPWQLVEYKKWEATPWSWLFARLIINDYTMHHAQRNFRDAAASAAHLYYASQMAYDMDHAKSNGSTPWSPTYWIFSIISGLMYAALPIQKEPAQHYNTNIRVLIPTEHAIGGHPAKSAHILRGEPSISIQQVFHNPPSQPEFTVVPPDYFQPINNPADYIPKIEASVERWKSTHTPVHYSWMQATRLALNEIKAFRSSDNSPHKWANWNFKIPFYVSSNNWVHWSDLGQQWQLYSGKQDNFYHGFYPSPLAPINQILPHPPPPAIIPMSGPIPMHALGPTTAPGSCLPPMSGPPKAPALSSIKKSSFLRYKYFTIASVADNGWIVDANPDDGSIDVYDLQALLDILEDDNLRFENVTECSDKGRRLLPCQGKLRDELRSPQLRFHVGKLLQWYRIQEVAEFNGNDDMPSWVIFGNKIFDVTEYTTADYEQQKWLKESAGGPIRANTAERQESMKDLLRSIREYQVGLVMPQTGNSVPGEANYLMTNSMLRIYDNPCDGVYTAINGSVYNIAGYVDYHPGGSQILNKVTGRDGTKIFLDFHPVGYINQPNFAALKIGRLIDERPRGDVRCDEVALHDFIFSMKDLPHEEHNLQKLLMPFYGSDMTHILTSQKQDDSEFVHLLTNFYLEHRQRIVARFPPDKFLREVTLNEVKQCNLSQNTAWVVVGDNVFDVTPLLIFPTYYDNNPGLVSENAGKMITCPATAAWLSRVHSHRIVARLTYPRQDSVSSINLNSYQELENPQDQRVVLHSVSEETVGGNTLTTRKRYRKAVGEDWMEPDGKRRYLSRV